MQRQAASPKNIEYFERDFLDLLNGSINVNTIQIQNLGAQRLFQIKGIPNFWGDRSDDSIKIQQVIEDLVSGVFESKVPLIYTVFRGKDGLQISYGTHSNDPPQLEKQANILRTSLTSSFHGIEIETLSPQYLDGKLAEYTQAGVLTGVPSETITEGILKTTNIERLLRGISRRN